MPIRKPWSTPEPETLRALPAVVGVYELADEAGRVIFVGLAGGRERFGLRGKLQEHFSAEESNPVLRERAARLRWESTQQYTSRRSELLLEYGREQGAALPPGNAAGGWADRPRLGRLRRSPPGGG